MPKPKITSVTWPDTANVGDTVKITIVTEHTAADNPVDLEIIVAEYSGPLIAKKEVFKDTVRGVTKAEYVYEWKVSASAEGKNRGLPEYRVTIKCASNSKESKTLRLGEVMRAYWFNPVWKTGEKGKEKNLEPRSDRKDRIQSYFRNEEEVYMFVEVTGLKGFSVEYRVIREADDKEVAKVIADIKEEDRRSFAVAKFSLKSTDKTWTEQAWNRYRFVFKLKIDKQEYEDKDEWRSGLAAHYSTILGFYGAGPTDAKFSNGTLVDIGKALDKEGKDKTWIVDAVTEEAAFTLNVRKMNRLLTNIAPEEKGMRLFGYSRGGVAANHFAQMLHKVKLPVVTLVGIDTVKVFDMDFRGKLDVPANVGLTFNYVQTFGTDIDPLNLLNQKFTGDLLNLDGKFHGDKIKNYIVHHSEEVNAVKLTTKYKAWDKDGTLKQLVTAQHNLKTGPNGQQMLPTRHETMPQIMLATKWYLKVLDNPAK